MDFTKLMRLAEAANGFSGSVAVDEFPTMSLTECSASITSAIYESQIEMYDSLSETNDRALEMTTQMLTEGAIDHSALESLTEASFKGILEKARALFTKLAAMFQSMAAKVTTYIDRIFADGKKLIKKYYGPVSKLSDADMAKVFEGVKGYAFTESSVKISDTSLSYIRTLVNTAFPGVKSPSEIAVGASEEDLTKAIDALDDKSTSEAKAAMAYAITGKDVSGDDWAANLRKLMWGEQVDLKYEGQKTLTDIKNILENPADLKEIRKGYDTLKTASKDFVSALEKELKNRDSKSGDDALNNKVASYYQKYIKVVQDAFDCISRVRGIQLDYERAKIAQARRLFGRMMIKGKVVAEKGDKATETKAEPEVVNSSIGVDEDFFFDFDD